MNESIKSDIVMLRRAVAVSGMQAGDALTRICRHIEALEEESAEFKLFQENIKTLGWIMSMQDAPFRVYRLLEKFQPRSDEAGEVDEPTNPRSGT